MCSLQENVKTNWICVSLESELTGQFHLLPRMATNKVFLFSLFLESFSQFDLVVHFLWSWIVGGICPVLIKRTDVVCLLYLSPVLAIRFAIIVLISLEELRKQCERQRPRTILREYGKRPFKMNEIRFAKLALALNILQEAVLGAIVRQRGTAAPPLARDSIKRERPVVATFMAREVDISKL